MSWFRRPCLYVHKDKDTLWFRVWGVGLCFTRAKSLFSERFGFKVFKRLPRGWRVCGLKKGEGRG